MGVYETGAGSAIAQVEGLCRHLTSSGTFDTAGQPTRAWVLSQLDLASAYIGAKLEEAGYSATQAGTSVLGVLQGWNVFRTCVASELANPISAVSGRGNARFQEFINREKSYQELATGAGLADLGATVSGGLRDMLLATGGSPDRKNTL